MTNKQNIKLLKHVKIDGITNRLINDSDKNVVRNNILKCLYQREFNKITQEDIALKCGVSIRTIQRFEKLEVNDLVLYFNYINILEDLPTRKKRKFKRYN